MPELTPLPPEDAPYLETNDENKLVLVKKGHRYVFDCHPGQEPQLLEQLQALVADPNVDLNWFDAAVLSHQMGQRMSDRLSAFYRNRQTG